MRWARGHLFVALVVVAAVASGCDASRSPTPGTSASSPTTPASSASSGTAPASASASASTSAPSSPGECTTDRVLAQVREMLKGRDAQVHYLTIAGDLTISIWLVDPTIDPAATATNLAENNRKGLETGAQVSYDAATKIPCARQLFVQVNPMIVDSHFQKWFIGFIPIPVYTALTNPTLSEIVAATQEHSSGSGGRRSAPKAVDFGGCTWPQARAAIDPYLATVNGGAPARSVVNGTGYLIIGGELVPESRLSGNVRDDVGVEVQWTVLEPTLATDSALLDRLGHLAEALACFSPHLDSLEAFIVDGGGHLVVYARIPGVLVRANAMPLPRSLVLLQRQAIP